MERNLTHRTVAVDLDGVIIDSMNDGADWKDRYDPKDISYFVTMKGCVRVLQKLQKYGFIIIVYTSRTNTGWVHNMGFGSPEEIKKALDKQLKDRGIPFGFIALQKPIADIYIDDRGWHFRDWAQMEKDLHMLGYFENENTSD